MGDNKWSHHRKASKKDRQKLLAEHRREQERDSYGKGKKYGK